MRKWVSTGSQILVVVGLAALVVIQAVTLPNLSAPMGQPSEAVPSHRVLFLVWSIICVLLVEVALVLVLVLVRARSGGRADQARIAVAVRWDALVAALSIIGFVIADASSHGGLFAELALSLMAAVYAATAVVCLVSTVMVVQAPGPAARDPGESSDGAAGGQVGQPVSMVERVLAVVVLVVVVAVQVYELPHLPLARRSPSPRPASYYPFFLIWFIVCLLLLEATLVLVLMHHRRVRNGSSGARTGRVKVLMQWDLLAAACMAVGLSCTWGYDSLPVLVTVPVEALVVTICLAATAVVTSVLPSLPDRRAVAG